MAKLPKDGPILWQQLQDQFTALQDKLSKENQTRLYRALSWLKRSEDCPENDLDGRFLFLWIAFNSAYGSGDPHLKAAEGRNRLWSDLNKLKKFLRDIVHSDEDGILPTILRQRIKEPIQSLLCNQYIFRYFWEYRHRDPKRWQGEFETERNSVQKILDDSAETSPKQTAQILHILFERLYILRNQIFHGGATHNGSVNRPQVQDGMQLLIYLVPALLRILTNDLKQRTDRDWGAIPYPPLQESDGKEEGDEKDENLNR